MNVDEQKIASYVQAQFELQYSCEVDIREYCVTSKQDVFNKSSWQVLTWSKFKDYSYPIFFPVEDLAEGQEVKAGKLQFDVIKACFLLLSGVQELLCEQRDKEGRFPYIESLQYQYGFVKVPVVNIYFDLLAECIRAAGQVCVAKTFDQKLVFTHDIDQLRSGWFEDCGFAIKNRSLKSPFILLKSIFGKALGLKDSYQKAFEDMLEIDRKHNTKAINFLMTEKSHEDADYLLENTLHQDLSAGPIGLHPGYYTYNDLEETKRQFERLESLFPSAKRIVRQHFLKYRIDSTLEIHEQLEVTEDYSLGFAEQYGFRNSIASPFYLFNFKENRPAKVLEIPLYFMEGTLIHYMKCNSPKARREVLQEVDKVLNTFNCKFSVLFHNTAFSHYKYEGFTAMYLDLIKLVDL